MPGIAAIVVVVYLSLVFAMGLYFSRRQNSTEEYFLGGRNIPGLAVAFSLIGTIIGSATFIGHPGEVFRTNMWNVPLHLMLLPVMLFIGKYIVVFYRRTLKMSVYGFLEQRFGYAARVYGGLAFIFNRIVNISATFYFLAVAVALLTSWEISTVIFVVGILTVCYTYLGGITAVVWTDVIQGIMLIGCGLACLAYLLIAPEAGAGEIVATAWEGGKFGWGDWGFSLVDDNVWVFLVLGLVWAMQRYGTDQHMVQRYLVARSDRDAKRAAYVGGMAALPIWILFWSLGALLWGYYQTAGGIPTEVAADQTQVMPYFFLTEFPPVMLGLVVAALTAAAMSSLDSDINSVAAIVVEDYYERLRPDSTDKQRLWVGRMTVIVLGALSIVAALQWIGVESAIGFMFDLISVAAAGVLGLFVFGIFFPSATARGALVGIIACVLFTAWATFTAVTIPSLGRTLLDLGPLNYELNTKLIGVFSNIILLLVAWGASRTLGGERRGETLLSRWRQHEADLPADPTVATP